MMLRNIVKFLFALAVVVNAQYGVQQSQTTSSAAIDTLFLPCLEPIPVKAGRVIRQDFNTAYYKDVEVFDFPVVKIWRTRTTEYVWEIPGSVIDERFVASGRRVLVPPDTFRFDRFTRATGQTLHFELCRFSGDIYQVWRLVETHYNVAIPLTVRIYYGIYTGWPDDYMNKDAYKTDRKKMQAFIEKYRCKGNDVGKRKAGIH